MDERFKELDECRGRITRTKADLYKWEYLRDHRPSGKFSVGYGSGNFQEIPIDEDLVNVCHTMMIDRIKKDITEEESRFREVCSRLSELAADVEPEG